ncbi:energy-coupling factor transporter ATP-binding protein EcfA [Halolactibacillus miurensis]|uniref:Energy-coupling factor transport system ATP-binding protein n=1 Tax=Halolactibacillus miurensis TaxID=306541 RepID=A0A1I6TGX2_9BACI|nr:MULTISPECIES: energy-coupling factor transporter ATPase [Halolactibacillus]GEM04653.1 energy-coupling factor transporter ATP-binding protein EcfA [Halolactibacillus miurensis]SFS88378.1 energy-coupling factor transport system ATP-binding protein [Halolactibacillus miurensis]
MRKTVLKVTNGYYRYDKRYEDYQLENINLSLFEGEWISLIGDNGSGKSTLAKVLSGLYHLDRGTVFLNGVLLAEETLPLFRKTVGVVFQNPDHQFIGTSVEDDVAFSLENQQIARTEMKCRVEKALRDVDMWDLKTEDPTSLSGGQKQRVQIAGLLAMQPDVMIFDEAFVMLDPYSRRDLLHLLRDLKETYPLTIISITHDPEEVEHSDRVIVMEEAKLKDDGTVADIYQRNHSLAPPPSEALHRLLIEKNHALKEGFMSQADMVKHLCT